eukprot:9033588-Lingulodinium_polyedra.AAC.1
MGRRNLALNPPTGNRKLSSTTTSTGTRRLFGPRSFAATIRSASSTATQTRATSQRRAWTQTSH